MKELIVVAYDNQDSAREVLYQLRWLLHCWVTEIGDAVVVVRDQEGNLHVQDSYQPTTRAGGGWGMLWGMLLGSVLLALLTGVPFGREHSGDSRHRGGGRYRRRDPWWCGRRGSGAHLQGGFRPAGGFCFRAFHASKARRLGDLCSAGQLRR